MVKKALSASQEDYLEAIFELQADGQAAHCKDIAARLQVKMPSATSALQSLAGKELVVYRPYEAVVLTPAGRKIAESVARRHRTLSGFFQHVLGVDPDEADTAACRMEHAIGRDIADRLTRFMSFVGQCPRAGMQWIRGCGQHDPGTRNTEQCERCIRMCLDKLQGSATGQT